MGDLPAIYVSLMANTISAVQMSPVQHLHKADHIIVPHVVEVLPSIYVSLSSNTLSSS
jgi:hypothetical protein